MKAILHLPNGEKYHIFNGKTDFLPEDREIIREQLLKCSVITYEFQLDNSTGYITLGSEILKNCYIVIS